MRLLKENDKILDYQTKIPVLEMRNISKSFPGVQALKDVDFELYPGEVCGLLGENGAGKSTLMNILGGVLPSDSGTITMDDNPQLLKNTRMAENLGISFIHQELSLFPNLDIASNIYIQKLPKSRLGFLGRKRLKQNTKKILSLVKLDHCRPDQKIGSLKIGEQQLVEIGRALAHETKVLILDEPTSSLSNAEIQTLFDIVRSLKKRGVAVVFITHRMDEIYEICDTLMVMRDGKRILKNDINEISRNDVITAMLGRKMQEQYQHNAHQAGEELLRIENLSTKNKLSNINLTLKRGELIGVYGLLGSGRTELLRCIFGLDKYDSGEIFLHDKPLMVKSPKNAIKFGIGMVSEDRHKEGVVLNRSVGFNLPLANLDLVKGRMFADSRKEKALAKRNISEMSIKTPSHKQLVQFLSGGNQQKVVVAKWLNTNPQLLIMDEPTRGIDIGAKREMYNIIGQLLEKGVGIIMASSELPELIGLCDHVIVLKEGRIVLELDDPRAITSETLLEAAMGGIEHESA